ncbi:MAG: nucleotidyltransferase family protein [Treponema sp.]|nr:nucleotidyltransferase family protein [Treponema sp.]
MNFLDFVISENKTILDALKKIDSFSSFGTKILFVTDESNKVCGSISDGDCRRALISGKSLDSSLYTVMNKNFTFLQHGNYDFEIIQKIRELGFKYVPELNSDGTLFAVRDFSEGKSYVPVDAVMMAGGKGERLRPLTLDTPKPLLKVADKPIIDYNIDNLMKNGINHINITVNYLKEQIEDHFKAPVNGVQINCVREPKFLGTIGSIKFVKQWYNDTILLMNSDLFTNIDIEAFYLHFKEHGADMSVAGVPYYVNIPYGIFELQNTREIVGITEKPSYHYYANAGIYLIKKELLDLIPENKFFDATDFIQLLIGKQKKVIRFPITGYWIDIGKPEDFKNVQEFARNIK